MEYAHPVWPPAVLDKLRIDASGYLPIPNSPRTHGEVDITRLLIGLSDGVFGVAKKHGEVMRAMPSLRDYAAKINHITNGVHTWTFLHPRFRRHYAEVFGPDWLRHPEDPATWRVEGLGEEFWRIHRDLRAELVREVRSRLYEQRRRNGESPSRLRQAERLLDPEALTVGFARRFATYKRAVLLFKDPERLLRILQGPYPVQFVFAGKAHPKDEPGKAYLQELVARIKEYGLEDRMVVLEDYDMYLARVLVHGSDVWLNTPRRPMEASGTSGMKAALNGVLNLSVLDGWWAEAYNGKNGFAIGDERVYENEEAQDMADAQALYDVLEGEVLPLFYAKGPEGYSSGWLSMVHESLRTVGPRFSAARMVREYLALYQRGQEWAGKARGEEEVLRAFHQALPAFYGLALRVEVPGDLTLNGEPLRARAYLEGEVPEALRPFLEVQLVVRRAGGGLEVVPMEEASGWFEVAYRPSRPGSYAYGVRMALRHPVTGRVEWVRWA